MDQRLVPVVKFLCIAQLIFLIPKIVSFYSLVSNNFPSYGLSALIGVENLVCNREKYNYLKKKRAMLVCDRFSFDQSGKRTDKLLKKNDFRVKKVISINKITKFGVRFLERQIKDVEIIFLDIQSDGINFGFIEGFLINLLNVAHKFSKKVIVLDRPNPLGGIVEGPGEIPWRHGLTTGELSRYIKKYVVKKDVDLEVVIMSMWRRGLCETTLVANKTFFHALECIKPILISPCGKSFQSLLLPINQKLSEWEKTCLKRICRSLGLHCFNRKITSCTSCKSGKEEFDGVKISLKEDISSFSAFNALLTIVRFLKNRKQIHLLFDKKFVDYVGAPAVKKYFSGLISFDALKSDIEKTLFSFYDKIKCCCLYKPLPSVVRPKIVKISL